MDADGDSGGMMEDIVEALAHRVVFSGLDFFCGGEGGVFV